MPVGGRVSKDSQSPFEKAGVLPTGGDPISMMKMRTRRELVQVVEQWGQQQDVDVSDLVFRLKSTPIPEE